VNVIKLRTLRSFWTEHKDAKKPLQVWFKTLRKNRYNNLNELKKDFPSADYVSKGEFTIFDIGGNKYRIVTFIRYSSQTVFIKKVFTHAEYDKWNKKGE
jgi:mRNA interferase HigB